MNLKYFAALAVSLPLAAGAIELDGIAAKVGSYTILKSDVYVEMQKLRVPPEQYNDIRNEMIERKLILKAAGESKMTMQEWVVENRLREIINRDFGGDRNRLMEVLSRMKISYPEWRQRMKDDMVVGAMRWQIVDKNVTASPQAMKEEYEKHQDRYAISKKMTVSVILLKPEDEGKRAAIGEALRQMSFEDVAKAYSVDSHASEGGVWKDVVPEQVFKPEICEELEKMPKGTISHWINIDGWYFLLRKDSVSEAKKRSFEEAYDDIEANVKEEQAKKLYTQWIDRLKKETYIKVY